MDEEKRHDDGAEGAKAHGKGDVWLTVIGIGKLIKVAILVSVGVAALVAVNHQPPALLMRAADFVGVEHDSHHLHRLVGKVSGLTPKKLEEVGFGCFLYAALFATEGVGLLSKKRWAEYFTICITLSFIPLEIYEIVHHASAAKVVTLLLNAVVAFYLVVRVRSTTSARAARHRFALSSTPIASSPMAFATASTVPRPQNGSTTTRDSTSSRR